MTSSLHSLYALLLRMCDQYHQTCTKHAQNMHKTCTEHAQNMHKTCTKHALLYYMKHHWLHNIFAALKMIQSVVKRISFPTRNSPVLCAYAYRMHTVNAVTFIQVPSAGSHRIIFPSRETETNWHRVPAHVKGIELYVKQEAVVWTCVCVGVGACVSVSPRMHHNMCGHTRELCGGSKGLYMSITVK